LPDTQVLMPNPNPNPTDAVGSDVAKESKEQVAVEALKNVLNEVMSALKKIGEDVENINKRVSVLEKSISIKIVGDKITVDGEKKAEKPKVGEYTTDTVEFAKSSVNTNVPTVGNNGVATNSDVQIIKSILTASKELSASDIYYLVRKNLKREVM
jgi:hypothetical protein